MQLANYNFLNYLDIRHIHQILVYLINHLFFLTGYCSNIF